MKPGDRQTTSSLLACAFFVALMAVVPNLAAERFRTMFPGPGAVPLSSDDIVRVDEALKVPGVVRVSESSIHKAVARSEVTSLVEFEDEAFDKARDYLLDDRLDEAIAVATVIVEQLDASDSPSSPEDARRRAEIKTQTRLLLTHAYVRAEDGPSALRVLASVEDEHPVEDFALWLQAEAHHLNDDSEAAARDFGALARSDGPLEHRATVRHAHALFDAGDWEAAAARLQEVVNQYEEYPRRHVALSQWAQSLDQLGRLTDAADAYVQTWFEYPFRSEGRHARARLNELENQHEVVPARMYSRHQLFRRFRELRINKHWDVADELFLELRQDHASESGHSAFEHEVDLQRALNYYGTRNFEGALEILESLEDAWKSGHRAGVSRGTVYKYKSRALSKLDRHEEALAALDEMNRGKGERSRLYSRAKYLEDHGRYSEALALYGKLYSAGHKRQWHYSWLLYKSGEYDDAYENLTRLAERSYGQRRAKYLYWAGRTLENARKFREARAVFKELNDAHPTRYYGIQAQNRLLDIRQRETDSSKLLARAENLSSRGAYVLDAFDHAEAALAESAEAAREDQRLALKGHEPTGPPKGAPSELMCQARTDASIEVCSLEPAPLPESARTILNASFSPASTVGTLLDSRERRSEDRDSDDDAELDSPAPRQPEIPSRHVEFDNSATDSNQYTTEGRIYWGGRHEAATEFAAFRKGSLYGPVPNTPRAYDEPGFEGGLQRADQEAGDLFPKIRRAHWLWQIGMTKAARWEARDVSIEFRELSRRWRPSSSPHQLTDQKWAYHIDNRRRGKTNFWGTRDASLRYPVPDSARGRRALLERQQTIYDRRNELRDVLLDAFKEVGDHFMVRRYTLGTGGWYRKSPTGPARTSWMQAYPRAFPRLVMKQARAYGVNPYLLWALMTVESSFNPDSISPADALGLLQVIPRTGLKTALLLGDDEFGPLDLLEEDVSVQHGAFYFSNLLHKFRGQELLAFAGYNGGPHRVGDWLDARGGQPLDEFIEEIPFDEARGYAKKVTRFLSLYLRMYEGIDHIYIGQNIRRDYRAHPKF